MGRKLALYDSDNSEDYRAITEHYETKVKEHVKKEQQRRAETNKGHVEMRDGFVEDYLAFTMIVYLINTIASREHNIGKKSVQKISIWDEYVVKKYFSTKLFQN